MYVDVFVVARPQVEVRVRVGHAVVMSDRAEFVDHKRAEEALLLDAERRTAMAKWRATFLNRQRDRRSFSTPILHVAMVSARLRGDSHSGCAMASTRRSGTPCLGSHRWVAE